MRERTLTAEAQEKHLLFLYFDLLFSFFGFIFVFVFFPPSLVVVGFISTVKSI